MFAFWNRETWVVLIVIQLVYKLVEPLPIALFNVDVYKIDEIRVDVQVNLRRFEKSSANNVISREALVNVELKIGDHDEEDHEHYEKQYFTG